MNDSGDNCLPDQSFFKEKRKGQLYTEEDNGEYPQLTNYAKGEVCRFPRIDQLTHDRCHKREMRKSDGQWKPQKE